MHNFKRNKGIDRKKGPGLGGPASERYDYFNELAGRPRWLPRHTLLSNSRIELM